MRVFDGLGWYLRALRMRRGELNIEFGVVRLVDQWVVVVSRAGRSAGSEWLIEGTIEYGEKTSGDYRNRGDYTDWDYERGD